MQKKNPVIKDYILSPKKRILEENPPLKNIKTISFDTSLYHLLSLMTCMPVSNLSKEPSCKVLYRGHNT